MDLLQEAKEGNRIYRLRFPDGSSIPFRLLTWQHFRAYWDMLQKGTIPQFILENAIFQQCVPDQDIVDNMAELRAGKVSTLASVVMYMSGPADPTAITPTLNSYRMQLDSIGAQIIMIICKAFPAYKPEDVENLPWPKILERFAQAERMLMTQNPPQLAAPLEITLPGDKPDKRITGKVDASDLVKEGRNLNQFMQEQQKAEPRQLTPQQIAQVEQIRKLKERRRRHG